MKLLINPGKSNNAIATVAIGDQYYRSWEQYAFPTWKKYCQRFDLGLIVFDTDLLPKTDALWKKPNWQKLLIGTAIKKHFPAIRNVCYIDTDIVINPTAPNVFDPYDPATIALVSLRKNLPYPYEETLRRVAYFRNKFYDTNYPLDSALFISVENLYKFHGLPPQEDETCSGFFVFNVESHSELLNSVFYKYGKNIESITGGGEQTHFNYEIQQNARISWLDYRFQAIWLFEMAWKYPFLYSYGRDHKELIRECIEASLFTNYFLHFAGSWHESAMWKVGGLLERESSLKSFEGFVDYLKVPVTGQPIGQVKPKL